MARSNGPVPVAMVLLMVGCGSDVQVLDGDGGGVAEGGSTSSVQGGAGQGASAQGGAGNGTAQGGSSQGGSSPNGGSGQGGVGEGGATQICDAPGPCGACVAQACPDVWCDCVNNQQCLPLFGCTAQCPDGPDYQACVQDCMAAYPEGISAVVLAADCAAGPCQGSCPQAGEPISPCEECLYSTCPDAMNACLSNSECLAVWSCLNDCPPNELSCHQGCYNAFPGGIEALEDVIDCSQVACEPVCN
ncbi:MAG: hypothetical protein IPM79_07765 [Polyangiaceae bacterium]|nr:hypothetical protein [Polyangiaceae bacterium]MBK8937530.1 hypothetical protein [Polyangiaceae bacterium]